MFHRLRTNTNAAAVAIRVGAVVLLAVVVALAVSPLAGAVVVAVGLTLAITVEALRPAGELREAEHAPHPHGDRRHVLVVADAELAGEQVAGEIARLAGPAARIDVLAPTLVSRAHYATSDHDAESAAAAARLERSLAWARAHGFRATGEVGEDEPVTAIADRLRDFGAEAVVVVTDGDRSTRWAERAELERMRAELDVPVAHVRVDATV